jgi:hypothetical protein
MSMNDFHSRLSSNRNEGLLLSALRKLTQVADLKSLFSDDKPLGDWYVWDEGGGPPPVRLATDAA